MLALPTKGISRSISEHNSDLDTMCDWIEGSVLFVDNKLSSADVVETLVEGNIYDDSDMGFEMVASTWTEISAVSQGLAIVHHFRLMRTESLGHENGEEFPVIAFVLWLLLQHYTPLSYVKFPDTIIRNKVCFSKN